MEDELLAVTTEEVNSRSRVRCSGRLPRGRGKVPEIADFFVAGEDVKEVLWGHVLPEEVSTEGQEVDVAVVGG